MTTGNIQSTPMFLLQRDIFPWDLAILVLLALTLCMTFLSARWFLRSKKHSSISVLLIGFLGFFGFLGFLAVAYGSFIEPHMIVTTRHVVAFPAPQKLRITVVSDLHLGPYKGEAFAKRIVGVINRTLPDVVLLAGDHLFTDDADPQALFGLRGIRAPLGTYAVIGNHDWGYLGHDEQRRQRDTTVETVFQSLGIRVLRNTSTILHLPTGDIALAGVDDPLWQQFHLEETLHAIPEGVPTILLSHSPDVILDPLSKTVELIVAGHTHAGQIRLPFIGPLVMIPDRVGNTYDQGLFPIDANTTLAITRGAGESGPRARLFAAPEVMVLETK